MTKRTQVREWAWLALGSVAGAALALLPILLIALGALLNGDMTVSDAVRDVASKPNLILPWILPPLFFAALGTWHGVWIHRRRRLLVITTYLAVCILGWAAAIQLPRKAVALGMLWALVAQNGLAYVASLVFSLRRLTGRWH
jgi:hypothetical protein